jgi:hypothetical protein
LPTTRLPLKLPRRQSQPSNNFAAGTYDFVSWVSQVSQLNLAFFSLFSVAPLHWCSSG